MPFRRLWRRQPGRSLLAAHPSAAPAPGGRLCPDCRQRHPALLQRRGGSAPFASALSHFHGTVQRLDDQLSSNILASSYAQLFNNNVASLLNNMNLRAGDALASAHYIKSTCLLVPLLPPVTTHFLDYESQGTSADGAGPLSADEVASTSLAKQVGGSQPDLSRCHRRLVGRPAPATHPLDFGGGRPALASSNFVRLLAVFHASFEPRFISERRVPARLFVVAVVADAAVRAGAQWRRAAAERRRPGHPAQHGVGGSAG